MLEECFNKASIWRFPAGCEPVDASARHKVKIRAFKTSGGVLDVFLSAFYWPPRKAHYCLLFLALRLTSGFISQTSSMCLTWPVWRPCRPFMFALSILCLRCFFLAFISMQGFQKNPHVAAKYPIFFGSCFHIFNSAKRP